MGVKRTQDSGRHDSLGREIKVSGQEAQCAGSSQVSGGEGMARGDFTSEAPASHGYDLAPLASALEEMDSIDTRDYRAEILDAARGVDSLREDRRRIKDGLLVREIDDREEGLDEIDAIDKTIRTALARLEDLSVRSKMNALQAPRKRKILGEQVDAVIRDYDDRGAYALRDPQFVAAWMIVEQRGMQFFNGEEFLDDIDSDLEGMTEEIDERFGTPVHSWGDGAEVSLRSSLDVDDETLERCAGSLEEDIKVYQRAREIALEMDSSPLTHKWLGDDSRAMIGDGMGPRNNMYLDVTGDGRYQALGSGGRDEPLGEKTTLAGALKDLRAGQRVRAEKRERLASAEQARRRNEQ